MPNNNHPEQMDPLSEAQRLLQNIVPGTLVLSTRWKSSEGDKLREDSLGVRPTDIVTYLEMSEKHSDEMRRWSKELFSLRTVILDRLRNGGPNRSMKEVDFEQFLCKVLQTLDDGYGEIVNYLEVWEDKWETDDQKQRSKRVQQFYLVLNKLNKKKLREMYCEIHHLEQAN